MLRISALVLIILPVIITASTVLPRFYSVNADSKIVGGLPINIEQTPYQISLQDRGFHICGGSIIAHNFVLTAAHCTDGNIARNLKIRAGSNYFRVGGELIQVKTIYQHELFDNEIIDYDFAILELLSELTFSLKIRPVELPQQNEAVLDETLCTISGWGHTQNILQSREKLRAAYVPTVKQETCNLAYNTFGGLTDTMICAGYMKGRIDSCQGDSGGPLVAGNKLIGVVSWGYGCAKAGFPGIYSKVSSVRLWIAVIAGV